MSKRLLWLLSLLCLCHLSWGGEDAYVADIPDSLFVEASDDSLLSSALDNDSSEVDSVEVVADTLWDRSRYRNQYGPGNKLRKYKEKKPMFEKTDVNIGPAIWLIVGMVVFLLIVVLVVSLGGYKRKGGASEMQSAALPAVDLAGGDLQKALVDSDYKEAIRILYVETLTWLNNRELIRWERSKTPIEYYYEMPVTQNKVAFKELTTIFLEARYDEIEVDRAMFDRAQTCANLIMKR